MPDNMDLNTFYKHALQWKRQQEATGRQAEQAHEQEMKGRWKEIAELIRAVLPIAGMVIMETCCGQFASPPKINRLNELDCVLDPERVIAVSRGEGRLNDGVIRVQIVRDLGASAWVPILYLVRVNGRVTAFDHPYEAFLQAYEGIGERQL